MSGGGYRDIYSGILHKCGGRIKSWTKRWMVLRSDYCLYYYKDATKNHLGAISLRDPQFKIRVGQKSDVAWPKNLDLETTFALVTTPRVYFMYAESQAEAEEWRKVLNDAHQDLLDVTRTKSFSGFRQQTTSDVKREAVFTSQSVREGDEGSIIGGIFPKPPNIDTMYSNTSSIFGRQFDLSSSSENSSPPLLLDGVPEVVESMYNVLQHPLVLDKKREAGGGGGGGGGGGNELDELMAGESGERVKTAEEETTYSHLPSSRVIQRPSVSSEQSDRDYDYVMPPDAQDPQSFSITVANSDQWKWVEPQLTVSEGSSKGHPTLSETSLEAFYDVAKETVGGNKQNDKQKQQQNVFVDESAVYDVIGPDTKSASKATPISTPPTNSRINGHTPKPISTESAVYDVIGLETTPTNSKITTASSHTQKSSSAISQPLPSVPHPPHPPSHSLPSNQGLIYEDIPDIPKSKRATANDNNNMMMAVYSVLKEELAVYEPVGDPLPDNKKEKDKKKGVPSRNEEKVKEAARGKERMEEEEVRRKKEEKKKEEKKGKRVVEEEMLYSVVGCEARTPPLVRNGGASGYVNVGDSEGGGGGGDGGGGGGGGGGGDDVRDDSNRGYVNVSHSPGGGNTPPPVPSHKTHNKSESSPPPPSIPPKKHTTSPDTTTPIPPPKATPTAPPKTTPTKIPTSLDKDRCALVKPQPKPRSRSNSRNTTLQSSPPSNSDQLPSNRESPDFLNNSTSEKFPVPAARGRTDSANSDPFSYSPILGVTTSQPARFSPPPSPRSSSPRPPSPLLSHRKVSCSETSRCSSSSSNHSNEGVSVHSSRNRTSSLKEKGIALFQRRKQEVASLAEQDTQRRKRSLTMLKGIQNDDSLSPNEKILFAETLREVENERMKASEEKFRWERERLQLEEERRLLKQERQKLKEELDNTRKEIFS